MMEFEYSPRHSPAGVPHLLSPEHAHGSLEGFHSIRQLRRSLSRSPSKPSRYSLHTSKSANTSPTAPISPSNLNRAQCAGVAFDLGSRPKYSVKRSTPGRNGARWTSPKSPLRRALSDNTNQMNTAPVRHTRRSSREDGQENKASDMGSPERTRRSQENICTNSLIIDFSKADTMLQPPVKETGTGMKSSPLKRSDGVMNLEVASTNSPRTHKRRSLHGSASHPSDFSIFDQGLDSPVQNDSMEISDDKDKENLGSTPFLKSSSAPRSPQRRPFSLRRSTLQQRAVPPRPKLFIDAASRDPASIAALTRAKSRTSLDSALPLRTFDLDSPFRRDSLNQPPVLLPPAAQKPYQSAPKPHPLSHALTPSSSGSSMMEDRSTLPPIPSFQKKDLSKPPSAFSKSLPIGTLRTAEKHIAESNPSSQESYATPEAYKMAKPLPQAFMSTGLISKRNRNVDMAPESFFNSSHMPDTPSKKAAHTLITGTPAPPSALGKMAKPQHEFGSPSTPFNARVSRAASESFGKGVSIFGSRVGAPQLTRRGSFISIDGDDSGNSPTPRLESQVSNDDLPPTPTKSTSTTLRPMSKGKSSSLRSSLFGRRTSLAPDTFASPTADEAPKSEFPSIPPINTQTAQIDILDSFSPHTPQESFTPPDPSSLSISAEYRPSLRRNTTNSMPPATPTGPRESFGTSIGLGLSSSYFSNDVDTSLTARFGKVVSSGIGEFSQVYRVEKPLSVDLTASQQKLIASGSVWAVKKSRRPYTGSKDRQSKMKEVHVLKALRGHEHVIELVDDWENKNHLYIQTEFCENGNLKDFLTSTGFKGRLDDFRIWKILLELCQGVQSIHDAGYMHLDLKPANVFIDWEGVLKIGDFGMASSWPAPPGIEGEGDREYIGPEVLSGRYDKPADIFALGMIMLEIAGNIVLPDNGTSWQRLRAGDMSDLPSLTWSSDNSLIRDESGDPVEMANGAAEEPFPQDDDDDDLSFLKSSRPTLGRRQELVKPPNFMVDPTDPEALERVVQYMIYPDPDMRPVIDQLLAAGGVQWVERRRRAGATIYEGNWGPADDVLNHEQDDVEMLDI